MKKLSGVIPAIPTPLLKNEDLDGGALCKIIDYVIEQGASGVMVLGNMGEGTALLDSVRLETVKIAVRHIKNRVPTLATCSNGSTRRTIELGKEMQNSGVDYLVSTSPYYYAFPHQQCIINYFEEVSAAINIPLWLYNNPTSTGNQLNFETIDTILQMENIAGIKDSSADVPTIMKILRKYQDKKTRPFSYLIGNEAIYDLVLLMGADGIVTGGGTCFVDILSKLFDAATNGQQVEAFQLQEEFTTQMAGMLGTELVVDWMAAIKTNLKNKGLCDNFCSHPFLNRMK